MFLERNKSITLINSLNICQGLITRKRQTKLRLEESILDLFMVCDIMLPHVVSMHVDEQGEHQLTNFYGKTHNQKVTENDNAKVEERLI